MERSGPEYSPFWMTLGDPITIIGMFENEQDRAHQHQIDSSDYM